MSLDQFKAREIGFRVQKKLLSRMCNKSTMKIFIDERSGAVLDNVYRLFKKYFGTKKDAEKLIKCIIKTIVKIGILDKNNQFDDQERAIASRLESTFHKIVMTMVSFYEIDFSYDYQYLLALFNDLHNDLRLLIQRHLKEKSVNRLNHVFQCITKRDFCDSVFCKNPQVYDLSNKILTDLQEIANDTG